MPAGLEWGRLAKNTPRLPGLSAPAYLSMRTGAGLMARTYLATCRRLRPFDPGELGKWMAVRAAERTCYGMPAEKPRLVSYIDARRFART